MRNKELFLIVLRAEVENLMSPAELMLPNFERKMTANEVVKLVFQKMLTRRRMMPSGHSLSGYLVSYQIVWDVSISNKKAMAKILTPT
jgi:hypothetical protein